MSLPVCLDLRAILRLLLLLSAGCCWGPGSARPWMEAPGLGAACPFSKPASVLYSSLASLEEEKLTYA